ncbi:GxxExxY protein [Ramlibacter sp.]|uniref:GxxExxY protein n=1 Tax=Ramlibacter sp. TaxID=1917967 RepID=UPI002CE7E78F|nr:GxxExxY protein [Ramlibacter sp.]HWI81921.1 GxxExxY protein [Ramlibacter sp.]
MNQQTQQPNAEGAEDTQRTQKEQPRPENDCSHAIIGAAVEVQRVLGVGLLESAYSAALAIELAERGLKFDREVPIWGKYKERDLGVVYRADFVVENTVIVELKAMDGVTELHRAQLLSYLRMSGYRLGLLVNFHAFPVVKGIHRLVNKL